MPDEPDPPRKVYGFKERTFQRDNAPASETGPMPTAKELAMIASRPAPARPAAPSKSAPAATDDPNDVHRILAENRQAAQAHGFDQVEIKPVKSRRARDFWLIIVGGNLAIIGAVFLLGPNPATVIFGLAGLIIFSLGLSWVMWQVMDKY